jgi:predicted anti-sigma-YlaC factor YlaD
MPRDDCQTALADLAGESWRFAQEYRRLLPKLDANEQNRYTHKLNYFVQRLQSCLEEVQLSLVTLEGQPYEMGIAADILNLDEYPPGEDLVIDQMIEPVIMGPNGIVKPGKAMVKRARIR